VRFGRLFAAASVIFWAGAAYASGGEDGDAVKNFGWYTLNFVLLVAVLIYFAKKPIQSFLADRRGQIQEQLKNATETLAAAERRHAELHRQLVDLDTDLQEIRERARERTESERDRILADATAAAERIEADAKAAVDREIERARDQLRHEASELAIELASSTLTNQVEDTDRDRLIDEFIDHIESSNGASPGSSK
jgi:F-type H+-transporting ATPase subunit b